MPTAQYELFKGLDNLHSHPLSRIGLVIFM